MEVPSEPPRDEITFYVLNTYAGVSRARRYLQPAMGGRAMPLPLGARDIDDWLAGHPPALNRAELDAAIFALDALERGGDQSQEA